MNPFQWLYKRRNKNTKPRYDGLPDMMPFTAKRFVVLMTEGMMTRIMHRLPPRLCLPVILWMYLNSPWEEYK